MRVLEDGIYTSRTSLKTGTQIRFILEGDNKNDNGPIYPYIFYTDRTSKKTVQVWPPAGNTVPETIAHGKKITIPANNQWITTNGSVSAENFIFLFSRKELDITSIRNSFEKQNGSIMDQLNAAAGNRFIPATFSLYDYFKISNTVNFLDMDSVAGIVFSTQYDKDGKNPLDMVKISGGSFTMGSPKSDPDYKDDEKQRSVRVNDFYMGSAAVTVAEFREFINSTNYKTTAEKSKFYYNWSSPAYIQEDNYPVVLVSWFDVMEYCNWRSKQEGFTSVYKIAGERVSIDNNANGYRLPTEAEWEYACRAGTTTYYNTNKNSISAMHANLDISYRGKPVSVKSYLPNKWGLFDMHGNVFEWTQDYYENSEYVSIRGGAWSSPSPYIRSAYRDYVKKDSFFFELGFRLSRSGK